MERTPEWMSDTIAELKAEIERLKMDLSSYAARDTDGMNDAVGMGMEIERLRALLGAPKWKSVDKDNMEFEARITCYTLDKIRQALRGESGDE